MQVALRVDGEGCGAPGGQTETAAQHLAYAARRPLVARVEVLLERYGAAAPLYFRAMRER